MTFDANGPNRYPAEGGGHALQIATAHLQVLLASIAGFDGKIMFLTALSVASISALVGIIASADPSLWLTGFGLAWAAANVLLGLGSLWSRDVPQFPSPTVIAAITQTQGNDEPAIVQFYLGGIEEASRVAGAALDRKSRLTRVLLFGITVSLGLVVAAALTVAL